MSLGNKTFIPICITEKAMCKMQYYCEFAPDEVGGLMEIEKGKDKILVTDIIIMKQRASAGDFYLDDEALASYIEKVFISDAKNKDDRLKRICGWWHKHPCAGWSTHDDKTFEELRNHFNGFVLGIVMRDLYNKRKKNSFPPLCRLEVGKGELNHYEGKNVLIQYNTPYLKVEKATRKFSKRKLRKKCKREVKKFITDERVYTNNASDYSGYYNRGLYDNENSESYSRGYWDGNHWVRTDGNNRQAQLEESVGSAKVLADELSEEEARVFRDEPETELDWYDNGYQKAMNPNITFAKTIPIRGNHIEFAGNHINMKKKFGCTRKNQCEYCGYKQGCIEDAIAQTRQEEEEYIKQGIFF